MTAEKEYGVSHEFIVQGIRAGELEYRDGAVWGNPYVRVLRSQLESYIAAQMGSEYLVQKKAKIELPAVHKEIAEIRKRLELLETRKLELERALKT